MRFFKDNSYNIVKLYINQFGITIFALMLYFSSSIVSDKTWTLTLYLLVSIFSTLFFYALVYFAAWEFGAKDRIRIDAGRLTYVKYKGLYLGLFAAVPNLFLAILSIICKAIHLLFGVAFFDVIFAVSNVILRFTSAMYMGVLKFLFDPTGATSTDLCFVWQSIGFVVLTLLGVFVIHFGYYMGQGCYHIADIFKSKKNT